ncbi:hypothetical protein GCM10009430_43270 [Aquimarina litoralis]|uniref:STAS/SEC14 domain-containing protein n=1 Tax=Aquimarina litoralis TaxID=584605 RepID=A0ABP3UE74_9FLAO
MVNEVSKEAYKKPLWKHHKGVEYIEINLAQFISEDLMIKHYAEACDMILQRPDKSVRIFTDITDINPSLDAIRFCKDIGRKAQRGIKSSAIIGTVGFKTIMLKIYIRYSGSPVKIFSSKDAALDYVTQL